MERGVWQIARWFRGSEQVRGEDREEVPFGRRDLWTSLTVTVHCSHPTTATIIWPPLQLTSSASAISIHQAAKRRWRPDLQLEVVSIWQGETHVRTNPLTRVEIHDIKHLLGKPVSRNCLKSVPVHRFYSGWWPLATYGLPCLLSLLTALIHPMKTFYQLNINTVTVCYVRLASCSGAGVAYLWVPSDNIRRHTHFCDDLF